jgi:MFS family permease
MESGRQNFHWYDYITVNNYWFAIAVRSQVMTPLVIPLLVQQFVGDEFKGTYFGGLRLWGLMVALLAQSVMGVLSDHLTGGWGRRRLFILIGTLGELAALGCLFGIFDLHQFEGFWFLFIVYFFSMLFSNTAQAGVNGVISDIVPDLYKSKFSAIKSLCDLPLSLIFFSFVVSRIVSSGNIKGAILVLVIVNAVCLLLTMFAPEKPVVINHKIDWKPVARLGVMVAVFTVTILSIGALVRYLTGFIPGDHSLAGLLIAGSICFVGMVIAIFLSIGSGIFIGLGKEGIQNQSFVRWLANRLAFFTGTNNLGGFLIYFLQGKFSQLKGIQAAQPVSGLIMITGISILLAVLPSGWLCDRFGKKTIIVISAFLVSAGVLIMVYMQTLELMTIGAVMMGIGTGLFYTANWALGTTIVPKEQAGLYLGIANIAGAGAGAIGAYIGGAVGDQFGYSLLMAVYGMIVLISIAAFWEPKFKYSTFWQTQVENQ